MPNRLATDFQRFSFFAVDPVDAGGKVTSEDLLLVILVAMKKNCPYNHRFQSATTIDPGLLTSSLQHVDDSIL